MRLATVKSLTKALVEAEEVYYLANGYYTYNFDELDIDTPPVYSETTEGATSTRVFGDITCTLATTVPKVNCGYTPGGVDVISNQIYFSNGNYYAADKRHWCVTPTADLTALANKVCQSDTGKTSHWAEQSGADWTVWVY